MATGTGKTRTTIKIINTLFSESKIESVVITVYGNDLLKQWEEVLIDYLDDEILLYINYQAVNEIEHFILSKEKKVLLVSRDSKK